MKIQKLIINILLSVLLIGLIGCSTKQKSTTGEPQKPSKQIERNGNDPIYFECADTTKLKYVKHELISNRDGKPTVLVYMDFTNNSEESRSVDSVFSPKVFQNGVECSFDYIAKEEMNQELENRQKQIQTGITIQVAFYFILQNDTDGLTLEVSDYAKTNELQKQKLAL